MFNEVDIIKTFLTNSYIFLESYNEIYSFEIH
jgi:hypothetical protein